MSSTSYQLTYRLSGASTVWVLIAAEIAILGLVFELSESFYLYSFFLYKNKAYFNFAFFVIILWLGFKLSRADCALLLDAEGFIIEKYSRFNFLSKGGIKYSWADFSYQSGAVMRTSSGYRGYELCLYLRDGKSFAFLTDTSNKSMEMVKQLHQDIEERVNEFRKTG